MMGTEMVPETSVSSYNQLTRLIAREDFIEFSRRENFKSYNKLLSFAYPSRAEQVWRKERIICNVTQNKMWLLFRKLNKNRGIQYLSLVSLNI
jgi:hypothetical protein